MSNQNIQFVGNTPHPIKSCKSHSHDCYEIILTTEGHGLTTIGGKNYNFEKGTVIVIPPNTSHSNISDEHFSDIFIRAQELIYKKPLSVKVYHDNDIESIKSLFLLCLRTFHRTDLNNKNVLNSAFELLQQLLIAQDSSENKSADIETFLSYLLDNFTRSNLNLTNAIKNSGYCVDHFRRRFITQVGVFPSEYLLNLRLEYAKKLLSQPNTHRYMISEIAQMSGFKNSNYFTRVFKEREKCSPNEYKKAKVHDKQK